MAGRTSVRGGLQGPGAISYNGFEESGTIPPLGSPHHTPKSSSLPYIDDTTPTNVTSFVGRSAFLSCRVRNLGNKSVSWIRHRDIHILTVGDYTYTSDQRFQVTYHRETDDWTLQIKWAQKRDEGIYECQINTQPVISYFVLVTIIDAAPIPCNDSGEDEIYQKMFADTVPTARILGASDLFVAKGSTINLTCSIHFSSDPTAYIFWYHDDNVISYDSSRGGVSVITEKGDITTSVLLIQNANWRDSGRYSCSPSNADVASVRVHVLNDAISISEEDVKTAIASFSCGSAAGLDGLSPQHLKDLTSINLGEAGTKLLSL
ncbi:uncharacterized protein LOC116166399 [Photinus pyralis]|uniref:uncharacterized protein LOC116166399 n=1 Tax=Photinus pyralis TaxID=7054 RepID=UPI00126773A8|nr:uncharacterized protein LOC116166399 [Photinus pyralis]